ncbi:MAG TPA: acyl carrier protein [Nitrospiraceae bacterium]|jgi:acyl carrier protein|nr:acyl carrier protein [Nitrospiraceae bacterium]
MALASVAERIQISLADYLKRDRRTITPAYSLRDDLGLDSMATIELLFRIEEAFEIQIPDEDLHKLATVGDVIAYVEQKVTPIPQTPAKPAARIASTKKKSASGKKAK